MQRFIGIIISHQQKSRRIALITLLYLIASAQALLPIDDPDIWWRLKTGQWIVEHRAPPLQDYFSHSAIGKTWIEYSWLFDLLMYGAYAIFNLPGLVYFIVAMALLITFVSHQLVRGSGLPFTAEIAVIGIGMGALKSLMTPRPWLFTITFFSLELLIIDRVRESRKVQLIWILPLVFWLWANVHIQFIYGLAVLGLFVAEAVLVRVFQGSAITIQAPAVSPRPIILASVACIIATLATPYHYLLYKQIVEYMGQASFFLNINELHPMFFRSPDNWLVLLLAVATSFVLGWTRKWQPFPMLLFLLSAILAFRARRDVWVLVLTAIWVIGSSGRLIQCGPKKYFTKMQTAVIILLVGSCLFVLGLVRQISEANLAKVVEQNFPVGAVHYINATQLPGPLFNDYDWGGFLVWSLPRLPVVIDGRLNLYTESQLEQSLNTWDGRPGWDLDPDLARAHLVIAKKQRMLTSLLRLDPNFKLVYEDELAAVFAAVGSPIMKN